MPDQRVGDQPALLLAHGEHAHLAVGVGQRAADAVEADAARHLLDQVDLAVEVGAERGHDRGHGVAVAGAGRRRARCRAARASLQTSSSSRSVPSTAFTRLARSRMRARSTGAG